MLQLLTLSLHTFSMSTGMNLDNAIEEASRQIGLHLKDKQMFSLCCMVPRSPVHRQHHRTNKDIGIY